MEWLIELKPGKTQEGKEMDLLIHSQELRIDVMLWTTVVI